MNIRLFLFAFLITTFQLSFANSIIDPATTENIARNVYFERSFQENPITFNEIKIIDSRTENLKNEAALYIFNFENGGFVIVSAEEALPPMIGYDLHGFCPAKGVNPNFDSFLTDYTNQISYIRENNIEPEPAIARQWEIYTTQNPQSLAVKSGARGVSPLLINLWNQDSPYNMLCPSDPLGPGGHVYAGCVATAMSMVMHYWRYPLQGTGSNGYSWEEYGYIFANFGETEYIFNNMQTEMDGDMPDVALLQFHCGVAVEMMYGNDGSGAYSWNVPGAIKQHFGYSNLAQFKEKENYSNTNWVNLLKEQIDLSQPMYYSGFSNSGGHAFVCDGYDDANLFHFNFGWSGSSNGFYTVYDVGGFSSGQGAVINFIPGGIYPYNYTGLQVITGKSGSIEDGSGPVANYISDNQVSWLISPQSPEDSISSITLEFKRFEIADDDQVTVYDGATESSVILGVYSGTEIPASLSSTGNQLLIVLQSNGENTMNGFLIEYTSQTPTWCSGMTVLTEPSGEIHDGSFDFNYDNSSNCKWMIIPENPSPTTLYFTSFATEPGNDKLLIYDFDGMALLADISGEYPPENLPEPVNSPSGKFFIVFISNNSISSQGFEAYYLPVTVGMDDASREQETLMAFPNPATNELNIQLSGEISGESQITIFNLSGEKVYEGFVSANANLNHYQVNISDYQPGIYVLIVRSGNEFYRKEVAIY
ncbi:MAG: C10 family peptidase [Bacteroidales bacterium]|nr:C10 family peptidase [Bacteroidales bacterium]